MCERFLSSALVNARHASRRSRRERRQREREFTAIGPVRMQPHIGRAVRIKRPHASTEFCNDAISQAPYAPAAGARSPPDQGLRRIQPGCMRCDEWGCGRTYDPHRQQWVPEFVGAACGALARSSLQSCLQEAAKTADAGKKEQQTWRVRI